MVCQLQLVGSPANLCSTNAILAYTLEPMGRHKYFAPFAGAAFVAGLVIRDENLKKAGSLAIGSLLANAVITHAIKQTFQRHRPGTHNENDIFVSPFKASGNTAFPSSHSLTAFTADTAVATIYQAHRFIPPISYGLATLVGFSRIQHNAQWATDVLAGAAVGYLSAMGVIYVFGIARSKLKHRI